MIYSIRKMEGENYLYQVIVPPFFFPELCTLKIKGFIFIRY